MTPFHRSLGFLSAGLLLLMACPAPMTAGGESAGADPGAAVAAPACGRPLNPEESLWCRATVPDPAAELPVIDAALFRMRVLGGICDTLADIVAAMIRRHLVRLFDPEQYQGGGAAPVGTAGDSFMLLSRDLITTFPDAVHESRNIDSFGTPRPETLQLVLAHEADHVLGEDHIDPDGYLTVHTLSCSDVR